MGELSTFKPLSRAGKLVSRAGNQNLSHAQEIINSNLSPSQEIMLADAKLQRKEDVLSDKQAQLSSVKARLAQSQVASNSYRLFFFFEQQAPAPHPSHSERCAAFRIVL